MLTNIHTLSKYDCSVNCIQWAPAEYGVKLIAGLSSGKIIVASYLPADETWDQHIIDAHDSSVNSISIAKADNFKFVSWSCDNQVYQWVQVENEFNREKIGFHDEWVRDVAYYNSDLPTDTSRVVSGGEDNKVKIWRKDGDQGEWKLEKEITKDSPVWRVDFSPVGGLLSVCSGDNQTTVYQEKVPGSGDWVLESILNEEGVIREK